MNFHAPWLIALVIVAAPSPPAAAADYYRTTGRLAVYLGVLPSALMGHSLEHPEKIMHGGVPVARDPHHVVVAVFDTRTGRRVTDADVIATVAEIGLPPATRKLEPMNIAGSVSYGNFFRMGGRNQYQISIQITPHGEPAHTVRFEFQHPR
jgi:hypothetical protein